MEKIKIRVFDKRRTCINTAAISALVVLCAIFFASCRDLSRNNPYDPSAETYSGIHYINEAWYPAGTVIADMAFAGGYLYVAGINAGTGCIIKITGPNSAVSVTSTPLGYFSNISGICGDDSGNIYITDDRQAVQIAAPTGVFTDFTISNMTNAGNMQIEWSAGSVYLSNPADKKIYRYSDTGVPASPDFISITCTATGYFTPGKIFKAGAYIYVVNSGKKNEMVRMAQDLSAIQAVVFEREVMDFTETDAAGELLSGQAVFRVDWGLAVALKWGDYGEGPGRIINGRFVSYDSAGKKIYIHDGSSIKIFGE